MRMYLYFNAVIYLLLAAWCVLLPEKTSQSLGFKLLNGSGRSEYFVVYGALQVGLAFFFAYCAAKPEYHQIGLIFSLAMYVPIFSFRLISFYRFSEIGMTTFATAGLELVLTGWAVYLYSRPG